ncbi:hypothetical protein AB5I83_09325 [Mesobacillus sp. LC4]
MVNRNYGKYPVPDTLKNLISLQKELEQSGMLPYGDLLGLYFSIDEIDQRYLNTPIDLISFARPGSDGIHFGFLTDFGMAADLEDAYIVRVSPMDFDDPVKIVARNLNDFLKLLYSYPASLEVLDMNTAEEDFKRFEEDAEEYQVSQEVRDIFKDSFNLEPTGDLLTYFQRLKEARAEETFLETDDGIGIVNTISGNGSHPVMEVSRDRDLKLEQVEEFFKTATPEARLRFLRDAQSFGLIFDDRNLKIYLREQMNLNDEAFRIMYPED